MSDHDPQQSDPQHPGPQHPDVGSVAEEAAKLVGAFAAWAQEHAPGDAHDEQAAGGAHDPHAAGGPECTWCPVCRGARWVRGTSPEVRSQLTTAAAALAQAASALLSAAASADAAARERGAGRPVEHIDLDPDDPQEHP